MSEMGLSRCWVRSSRFLMCIASGNNAHRGSPCFEGLDTESTLRCGCDEMATDVESAVDGGMRSEEHTSELQSHHDLVCRLLLEKKKKRRNKDKENKNKKSNTDKILTV